MRWTLGEMLPCIVLNEPMIRLFSEGTGLHLGIDPSLFPVFQYTEVSLSPQAGVIVSFWPLRGLKATQMQN